jgi:hypothetical protein
LLEKAPFSLQNKEQKTQHRHTQKKQTLRLKVSFTRKLNIFLNVSDFPRSH